MTVHSKGEKYMKKINMSSAFFFLTIYVLLSISEIISKFTGIGMLLQQFSVAGLFGYVVSLISALVPIGFLVLLFMNTKKDIKQFAWIALLVAGALEFYSILRFLMTLPMLLGSGVEMFDTFPQFASVILSATVGTLLMIGAMGIKSGKKPKLMTIALVCGFVYLFPAGFSVILGKISILHAAKALLLIAGVTMLPATLIDRKTAPSLQQGAMKIIAWAVAIVLLFMGLSALLEDNSRQKAGATSECKYCHREFDDSGNKKSIAKTGMCSNCAGNYEDLSDWVDKMDD